MGPHLRRLRKALELWASAMLISPDRCTAAATWRQRCALLVGATLAASGGLIACTGLLGLQSDNQLEFVDGASDEAASDAPNTETLRSFDASPLPPADGGVVAPACSPNCEAGSGCGAGNQCASGVCAAGTCVYATSCLAILQANPAAPSRDYPIDPTDAWDGGPFPAYCDMASFDGGWTLVGSLVSAGFGYEQSLTPDPGVATTTANQFGTQPAGTVGRIRIEGTGPDGGSFSFDLATVAPSATRIAFPDTAAGQVVFGPYLALLGETNASVPPLNSGGGLSVEGSFDPCSGGTIWVFGEPSAVLAGVPYTEQIYWFPVLADSTEPASVVTMDITEFINCEISPTGVTATGVHLYYR
jgi:hypothetical protein